MTISTTISFLGIDERSKSAYQFYFKSFTQIQCDFIDDYSKAQLCLVDKDSYNIQQLYETLIKSHSDKYILVLSLREHTCTHNKEFFLKKPIQRDSFKKLMNQIFRLLSYQHICDPDQAIPFQTLKSLKKESQAIVKETDNNSDTKTVVRPEGSVNAVDKTKGNIVVPIKTIPKASTANVGKLLKVEHEEHFVGEQPDIDINKPEQLENIFYEPNKLLQAVVEKACIKSRQSEKIIQLVILNHVLYFDYQEQKVYSNVRLNIIRPLCLMTHINNIVYHEKDNSIRNNFSDIFQTDNNNKFTKTTLEKQCWDMQSFIWLITLWSSRGRVPQGTVLTQPVYLRQWPNLTRLTSIPHALRIAALIYDQPRTLIDVAKQLGIKQRYVFAFFSACKSIGLSDIATRDVDNLFVSEKPEQPKNQSILSKILGKLVNFSNKSSMNETA